MSYHVGDVVRLSVSISVSGVLTDPGGLSIRIKTPSEDWDEYQYPSDIIRDSVGMYHYDLELDQVGDCYFKWVSTGVASAAAPGGIYVSDDLTY